MTAIAITGIRAIDPNTAYGLVFDQYLRPFATPHTRFFLGGAEGIDTEALAWLVANTQSTATIAVPNTLAAQPESAQEVIRMALMCEGYSLVELRQMLTSSGYYHRNRWMVDRASLVIGFPSRAHPDRGGTAYTLRYASGKRLPRLIIPV
jgi:hypothetical protein